MDRDDTSAPTAFGDPAGSAPRDAAYRVLLIEDDEADTVLFEHGVGEADPELVITTATSIADAERSFAGDLDCIVLDLGLPGSIDLEALAAVRSRVPDVAVVVLTGWGDQTVGTAAVATGAQDYLIKGEATGPTIARSIRFAIERKRTERSTAALLRAQLLNLERERLERALLATPSIRRDDVSWVSRYSAARTGVVSGDFVDGVELPDGTLRAVIGDVAGHGPDEAALGVSLRAGWRALVLSDVAPERVLACLEELLLTERSTRDSYATVCDLAFSPNLRSVTVRTAGHPPPVLAGVGPLEDEHLRSPLGMRFGDRRWDGTTFELPEVWSIALYTDGLFEIRADDGEIFSMDDVPTAVDAAVTDGFVDPDRLLARFRDASSEGWRDDVAVAVISSSAWATP